MFVNSDVFYIIWQKRSFCLRDQRGKSRAARSANQSEKKDGNSDAFQNGGNNGTVLKSSNEIQFLQR